MGGPRKRFPRNAKQETSRVSCIAPTSQKPEVKAMQENHRRGGTQGEPTPTHVDIHANRQSEPAVQRITPTVLPH